MKEQSGGHNTGKRWRHFVIYRLTPELLAVVHVAILIWVFSGTVAIFFYRNYIGTHIIVISVIIVLGLFLGYCPLTKVEEVLRQKDNSRFTLKNSFMAFYVNKIFGTNFSVNQINGFQIFVFAFSYGAAFFLYFIR